MESGALRTVISWVGGLPGCAGSPAVLGGGPTTPPRGIRATCSLLDLLSAAKTMVQQGVSFQSSGAALVLLGTRATVGTGVAMEDPSPSPSSC